MDIGEEDQDQVEILVHISAPSKGTDDAAYRAFATAYLAFEPARTYTWEEELSGEPESSSPQDSEDLTRSILANIEHRQANFPSTSSMQRLPSRRQAAYPNDKMLSALKSPDPSFESVMDNLNSPKFYRPPASRPVEPGHTSLVEIGEGNSWETVSDSQPPTAPSSIAMTFPSKVPKAKVNRQTRPPVSTADSSVHSAAGIFRHNLPTSSNSTPLPNFTKPSNSSLELPTLPRKRRRMDEPEENQSKPADSRTPTPTPIIFPFSSNSVPNPVEEGEEASRVFGPPQKRQRRPESAGNRTRTAVKPTEGIKSTVPTAAAPKKSLLASYDPNIIRSPLPETSISSMSLSDIITPCLTELAESPLKKSWREEFVTRDLRDMERGYWLVNYSTWDAELRSRSWNFFKAYFERGLAGWGVWCVRSPETEALRVYCWGRIVKHIYLLLHIAGERAVKRTGATWFDADGVAVVVVPPRLPKERT